MGGWNSKDAVIDAFGTLLESTKTIPSSNDTFWSQFYSCPLDLSDLYELLAPIDIRKIRDENSENLKTLLCKLIQRLQTASLEGCNSSSVQSVLGSIRILTRVLPFIFEETEWREWLWATLLDSKNFNTTTTHNNNNVTQTNDSNDRTNDTSGVSAAPPSLCESLILSLTDLCFCPGLTIVSSQNIHDIDSRDFIWEAGVGMIQSKPSSTVDPFREEVIRLLLVVCASESFYHTSDESTPILNRSLSFFVSHRSKHSLPLFCSLLNIVCAYDPVGYGIPFNYKMFANYREPLVDVSLQFLIVVLDYIGEGSEHVDYEIGGEIQLEQAPSNISKYNMWCNYVTRLHRTEDFKFILNGFTRLLNNPLRHTYIPGSSKKINFHQELLILFWKMCDLNKSFLHYLLKSSDVLDILMPILYYCVESRKDISQIGVVHVGTFVILMLSGERNFGVRLNKSFTQSISMDIPAFEGTYADLLIICFHKIISTGHGSLGTLHDCLLTILVNISPYLKSLSITSSVKLVHLFEHFSTPKFLFSRPTNHHMTFFMLEIFNNLIQYQFDGNSHLVYTIIRQRRLFERLANLSLDKYRKRAIANNSEESSSSSKTSMEISSNSSKFGDSNKLLNASPPTSPTEHEQFSSSNMNLPDFSPTQAWLDDWKEKLPLHTITRMLQVLVPQVEKICLDRAITDEADVIDFLKHGTLVGLLPVPHPIVIRRYQPNSGTTVWLSTFLYGVLYLKNVSWSGTKVQLFRIETKPEVAV